ncbi:MAG: hypothetical protein WB992_06065 [Bryobacteraceae bacterium]
MPEETDSPNGHRNARMDRIERALELLIADHEQFRHDYKQLLTAHVLQQDSIHELYETTKQHTRQIEELKGRIEETRIILREQGAALDERIGKLVSAIAASVAQKQ